VLVHVGRVAMADKKRARKSSFAKFCPKCGSGEVFWAQGLPQLWSIWQCRNCGYQGPMILEDGNLVTKLQEKWKTKMSAQKESADREKAENV
jgi:transcription factor S